MAKGIAPDVVSHAGMPLSLDSCACAHGPGERSVKP